jgi:glycosyltransferase involved in cell wall biosynthesis
MQNEPLVSVLLPVFNAEHYIEEALKSIINQTYKNLEIIVVNDGSTDTSLSIIEKLAKQDNRIVIINKNNSGIVNSLNLAIEKSRGKYLVRMDADDISLPYRITTQVDFMEKNQNIDICGSYIQVFGNIVKEKVLKYPLTDKYIKEKLIYAAPFAHPAIIIRRKSLINNHLKYNDSFQHAEDYALYVYSSSYLHYANIPKILLKYRMENNITKVADKDIDQRMQILSSIAKVQINKVFGVKLSNHDLLIWFSNTRLEFNLYNNYPENLFLELLKKLASKQTGHKKNLLGFVYMRWLFKKKTSKAFQLEQFIRGLMYVINSKINESNFLK